MGSSKLLIVIDMQEGFRYKNVENLIPNILKLSKKFSGNIIFTYFENLVGSNFEKVLNWKKFQNKEDQKILKELKDIEHEKIHHNSYNILDENLLNFIKDKNIKEVYVAGIYLDVCIVKFVQDCFDNNILVKVISDCVTSQDFKEDTLELKSLGRVIGKQNIIISSEIL